MPMLGLKSYLLAAGVLFALFCLWGISRNWSCRQPKPPHISRFSGPVLSVDGATALTIEQSGRLGRRTWNQAVLIDGLVVTDEAKGKTLTEDLCPIGSTITVTVERRRIFGDTPDADSEGPSVDSDAMEGKSPLVGQVMAANGQDVGQALIDAKVARRAKP